MKKNVRIIKEVNPIGDIKIVFNSTAPHLDRHVALNPFRTALGHTIKKIHFFNESGIVHTENGGWLRRKDYSNNYYNNLEFVDGLNVKRKENYTETKPYYISKGADYMNDKTAELYIPFSYVEALGYKVYQEVREYDYETHIEDYVVVGDDLFSFSLESKREKHWDKKRLALLHELCTNTTTEEEFKAVLKQFDIRL